MAKSESEVATLPLSPTGPGGVFILPQHVKGPHLRRRGPGNV